MKCLSNYVLKFFPLPLFPFFVPNIELSITNDKKTFLELFLSAKECFMMSVDANSMVESWLCKNLPVQISAKLLKKTIYCYQIKADNDNIEGS